MAASLNVVSTPAEGSVPYVGLRPFEEHESDFFFGRGRDADLLCDKILSGPLTILYAQSGLGKSSLLRAIVIPRLRRANHARIVYFDAWAQKKPLHLLKDGLLSHAYDLGIPDAGRGSPTLAELARMLCSADDKSLVLVLDQFEEFLVHHAQSIEPLRSELAALLRSAKLDVTVVLSLREDFLAALEPLRQQILNLFQSTYRLEPLEDDALMLAIERPPQLFGGECERGLTKRLMEDLRSMGRPLGEGAGLQLIELPMLQLVCQQLWSHAGQKSLTLGLYDQLGGAERIINDYVRGLMPKRWADQSFTARLLQYLAPPSGLKRSYAAEDLADQTRLDGSRIAGELERLSVAGILHPRQFRKTAHYELQHEAFIPVLRAWRDQVMERERRIRWTCGLLLTAICVAGFVSYWHWFEAMDQERTRERNLRVQAENDRSAAEKARSDAKMALAESDILRKRLENWETSGLIEELNDPKFSQSDRDKLAPGRFEVLTYYVLWKTQGEERFDRLRRLLEKNANLIPDSYLIAPETEPRTTPDWPLVVEYSPDGLKPTGFNAMWGSIRDDAFKKFGIPLPVLARLSADDHLSRGQLRITNPDKREVLLTAPADGQYMIKWPPDPLNPGPARDFVQRFNTAWVEFKPNVQEYRLVPRWSLPFWKLADQTPTPPGGIAAYLAVLKLLKRPDLVFSKVAVNALLDQAAKTFPQTVAEARAARGDEIGPELAKRLQKYPKALAWLPSILDELSIPEQPPTTNTASTAAPARNSKDAIPSKDAVPWEQSLNGAWPAQSAKNIDAASKSTSLTTAGPEPYGDLGDRLGDFEPIRVNVATNLLPEWFPNDKLSQKLSEKLEDLRADVYARYGVNTPGFRFHPPNEGQTMAPNTIQVHVFEADSDPLLIGGPNKLQSLLSKLSSTLIDTREKWVTAETTDAALKRMPQNTRDWLQKRYSLTDLKRLLRHAVRSSSKDGGSVRYPTWMMNSLVFWVLADNPLDRNVLGDRLFSEQRVRLGKLQVPPADEMARIDSGVDALLDDDPTFATQVFQETLKIDRQRAIDAFNVFWARRSAAVWLRELRNEFGNLDAVAFDRPSQLDLEEQSKAADQTGDRASAWALTLYRFAAARSASSAEQKAAQRKPPSEPSDLQQVRRDLLSKVPDLQQVRPEEARWLAQRFLEQFSPLNAADAPLLETATRMLLRAVDGSVDGPTSLKIFTDMLDVAQKTPTPNWAWMLLDRLATVRPGDAKDSLALELAWNLCRQERIEPLIRALALADSYEEKVTTLATTMSQEDRETASVNIKDVRANVYLGLRQLGDNGRPSPEPLLRELARSAREDLRREVNLQLIQFLDQNDRHAEAVGVGQEAAKEWPDDVGFLGLIGSLQYGDRPDVMALAQSVSKKVNGNGPEHTDKGWLLTASLAGLMAHTSDWRQIAIRFLATQHDYVDYVRMIARAMDSGSDSSDWKKVLDERWKSINPASWRDRIRNGDVTAWREMLIGRFVEAKESENLLTTLDDPAAWAKSDFVNLPTSLKAQRCEAWFYEAMRAKAKGRKDAELDALRRSAATGYSSYFEYAMARFLLANGG